jgi:predicted RNA methylase
MPYSTNIEKVDSERRLVGASTSQAKKSELGQFLTPAPIATFMAKLLPLDGKAKVRVLDPGAGIGALSVAVLDRRPDANVVAYEIDEDLLPMLRKNLGERGEVISSDFIQDGVFGIKTDRLQKFTHAILNPPYKKISTASQHRQLLRKAGLETVNLYSGFVGVALMLLKEGGHLCAIIPRSFCNGPYYRGFRHLIRDKAAIKHMHLFDARHLAFADDDVLQENVIILLERGGKQGKVTLSSSTDATFADLKSRDVEFDQIIRPGDDDFIIHFPTDGPQLSSAFNAKLTDLDIQVSTGPVVDFRLKEHLRAMPEAECVPLIYPAHFGKDGAATWPIEGLKKPNAILVNDDTAKWLFPNGDYVVVRRFSSKEERRRIVATPFRADDFDLPQIGFENHLNVFHRGKRGLPRKLMLGLVTYLNSTAVDEHFRVFNGHTQVNATDLRMMPYPQADALERLGMWAAKHPAATQEEIDERVGSIT